MVTKKLVKIFATVLTVAFLPVIAKAECFAQKPSKGGADLYIIGEQATVRIERTGEGFDLGIKVNSGVAQSTQRVTLHESESAEIIGEQVNADGRKTEIARVFFAMGQLVIIARGKALIKDLSGDTQDEACLNVTDSPHLALRHTLQGNGSILKAVNVEVVSNDRLASALGL